MNAKKNTVLVIDGEPQTARMLKIILPEAEFFVESCTTGKQAVGASASLRPDIILLDLNLPDMPGNDVIRELREWSHVPLIIVTSCAENEDVIAALNLGADDYVIKPFNLDVLQARIKANLRKGAIQETGDPELVNGFLRMDLVRHQVFVRDRLVPLTPKEYNLLRYFMKNRGKMLTHKDILTDVWGKGHVDDAQYLRVFVGQIRKKINPDNSFPSLITTTPGIGYRMETDKLSE